MPDLRKISYGCGFCPAPVILTLSNTFCEEFDDSTMGLSPDILTSLKKIENPTRIFGDRTQFGDGLLDNAQVVAGEVNFVYVRIRNRGGLIAKQVIATVYSAPLATLITPDDLIEVGRSDPLTIPIGCNPVITNAIPWNPDISDGEGRTLVVQLSLAEEPLRPLPQMQWLEFLATLCNSEQVAQRSIQVVDISDATPPEIELPFSIKGKPDGQAVRLDILRQLPQEIDLTWEIPDEVFKAIAQANCIDEKNVEPSPEKGKVRLRLSSANQVSFPGVRLPAGQSYPSKLLVRGQDALSTGRYSIAVRQRAEGNELGRVTFALRPPKPIRPPLFRFIDRFRGIFD